VRNLLFSRLFYIFAIKEKKNNMNTCSFKVVEERGYNGDRPIRRQWITLATHVDYDNNKYITIQPFHKDWIETEKKRGKPYFFNLHWIKALFDKTICTNANSFIQLKNEGDVNGFYDYIRNPTIEEMMFIKMIFKMNECTFNRKTNQLIKL
jgi:hypothetical protein